jgi:hypothetical protein
LLQLRFNIIAQDGHWSLVLGRWAVSYLEDFASFAESLANFAVRDFVRSVPAEIKVFTAKDAKEPRRVKLGTLPAIVPWLGQCDNQSQRPRANDQRPTTGVGRLLTNQQGQTRESELSGGIVDDVDLTGVETGFELGKRHVELEDCSLAVRRVQLGALD